MSRAHRIAAVATCALSLGGALYLFARHTHIVMFDWVEAVGLGESLRSARAAFDADLPGWLVYSAPAACWAFAFAVALWLVWRDHLRARVLAFGFALFAGLGHEIAQLPGLLPGTFDYADLLAYAIGYALALAVLPRSTDDQTIPAVDSHCRPLRAHGAGHEAQTEGCA